MMKKIELLFLFFILLSSCDQPGNNSTRLVSSSIGKIDDIIIVMNKTDINSQLAAVLRKHFETEFLITPQFEPEFNLRFKTPEQFNRENLKKYSTIIFASEVSSPSAVRKYIVSSVGDSLLGQLKSDSSIFFSHKRNVWAQPQMVISLFGISNELLIRNIDKSHKKVSNLIHAFELMRSKKMIYTFGQNKKAEKYLSEVMNIDIKIPVDYKLTISNDSVVWIRKETIEQSSNLLIYQFKVEDSLFFEKTAVLPIRDRLVKKYITSQIKDSYMKTDTSVYPVFQRMLSLKDKRVIVTNGLWNIHNDFMGGAFINYLVEDNKNRRYIMLDGFIHAPKLKKKHFIRYLEAIIRTGV